MHDAEPVDVIHAGRDVLEAKQHAALRGARPGITHADTARRRARTLRSCRML